MTARGGDFWARRKAAVQAEEAALTHAADEAQAAQARAALEEKDDAEILAELNLPDPDSLQPGDDVSRFLSKAVPDRLRRRALRRLWRLNPVLANVDGLVDYGEDFTDSARVIENLQTAYQVGRGMLRHVEEMARQAETAADDPAPEDDAAQVDVLTESDMAETAAPALADAADAADTPADDAAPQQEVQQNQSDMQYAAAQRRRMRFVFEG